MSDHWPLDATDWEAIAKKLLPEYEKLRAENEFLIRLIRGEGNQDMIEQMEHFLGIT